MPTHPLTAPAPWYWSDKYRTLDNRPTWTLLHSGSTKQFGNVFGILSCDGEQNSPDAGHRVLIASAPTLATDNARLTEQNAALVTALEHIENSIDAHDGISMPKWVGGLRTQARTALAQARTP